MRRRWSNWAGTVRSSPSAWHVPASEDEIAGLVRGARGRTLRVVGAGHSWSAIAAPEQIGISLDRLSGLVAVDRARGIATVRAGTRLHAFNAALAAQGLALPIVGSIAQQALAGAIATGTHGSSLVHGNLATLVERMRLVDGRGERHELTGDALDAARVHLGALGVVTELAFRVVPAFRLAETVEAVPVEDVAGALPTIARSAEYVKVWWLPHTRHACIIRHERTQEPSSPGPPRLRWVDERILHAWVFPAILRLGRVPGLTRRASPLIGRTLIKPRRVGPSALMLSTPMPARHRETEAIVPLARAPEAFDRLVHLIDRERLSVNFIVEARFVPGDRGWMSPAYGDDPTCHLGAYCYGPGADPYFGAFWREMRVLAARPHWGKEHDHGADEIRALWPRAADFGARRDELDPDRVFASRFHTRILGT